MKVIQVVPTVKNESDGVGVSVHRIFGNLASRGVRGHYIAWMNGCSDDGDVLVASKFNHRIQACILSIVFRLAVILCNIRREKQVCIWWFKFY